MNCELPTAYCVLPTFFSPGPSPQHLAPVTSHLAPVLPTPESRILNPNCTPIFSHVAWQPPGHAGGSFPVKAPSKMRSQLRGSHSREKPALSLPKGGNPVAGGSRLKIAIVVGRPGEYY
jgi:hypothetical protein